MMFTFSSEWCPNDFTRFVEIIACWKAPISAHAQRRRSRMIGNRIRLSKRANPRERSAQPPGQSAHREPLGIPHFAYSRPSACGRLLHRANGAEQQMRPEGREKARQNFQTFRNLPPEERKRVIQAFHQWRQL